MEPRISEKKRALIETATRLFGQFGYHAVGIDRIIAESQVAKMTMYKYFPSKSKLIVEVLNTKNAVLTADIATAVNTAITPIDKLHAVFLWHDAWFKSENFSGSMFNNAAAEFQTTENEILAAVAAQKESFIRMLENILKEIVDADNATRLANRCMLLLDGATVTAQVSKHLDAALEAWEITSTLVENERLQLA